MLAPTTTSPHHPEAPRAAEAARHGAAPLDLCRLAGAAAWARLPAAVQRRFAPAHAAVTYHGHMDLRCSRAGRVFAALARLWGGPLAAMNAQAVPTTVNVQDDGRGGVVWERCFHAGAGAGAHSACCTVRSTKELDAAGGLRERTDGGLSMSLDVLEDGGALVFVSRRFWWVLGGRWCIPVPARLTPGICRVAHTDLGGGRFRFTLSMVHPWWGETFHQSGVFTDPAGDAPGPCSAGSASPPDALPSAPSEA